MPRDHNDQSLHVRNNPTEGLTKPYCKGQYLESQTVVKRNGKVTLSNQSNSLKLRPTTSVVCEHLHIVTLRLFGTNPSPYLRLRACNLQHPAESSNSSLLSISSYQQKLSQAWTSSQTSIISGSLYPSWRSNW